MVELCEAWFTIMTLASSEHFDDSNFVFFCVQLCCTSCTAVQVRCVIMPQWMILSSMQLICCCQVFCLHCLLWTDPWLHCSLLLLVTVLACSCKPLHCGYPSKLLYFCVGRDSQNLYSLCTPVYDLFEIMCDQFYLHSSSTLSWFLLVPASSTATPRLLWKKQKLAWGSSCLVGPRWLRERRMNCLPGSWKRRLKTRILHGWWERRKRCIEDTHIVNTCILWTHIHIPCTYVSACLTKPVLLLL